MTGSHVIGARSRAAVGVVAVLCGLAAVGARLILVRADGGLLSTGNYDDSVYFGSALALVHGRLPYRDFLLLQPPGITLLLAPFALLARGIGDSSAWAAARVLFVLIGGLNAALGAIALRRSGLAAAAVGGGVLALSYPVMYADRSTLLECAGDLGLVAALALLSGGPLGAAPPRLAAAAGVALGLATGVKVFYLVPLVLLALLLGRRALPFAAGAVAALAAVLLPFFVVAPAAMWRQVVADQVGRPVNGVPLTRWTDLLQPPPVPHVPAVAVLGALTAGAVVVLVLALLQESARRYAVLAIGGTALLFAAPSFYRHYAVLAVVPFALATGAVVGPALGRLAARGAVRRTAAAAAALVLAAVVVGGWKGTGIVAVQGVGAPAGLAAALARVHGCVTTLSPGLMILTDEESRQLAEGCPVRVDPTGEVYDRDLDRGRGAQANPRWQADVTDYLTSGAATLLWNERRWRAPTDEARVTSGRRLYSVDGFRLLTTSDATR